MSTIWSSTKCRLGGARIVLFPDAAAAAHSRTPRPRTRIRARAQNSDVVCFESAPADDEGLHAAVMFGDGPRGAFPPNTLFELKEERGPGEWEAPNGTHPARRLYMVYKATYRPPRARANAAAARAPTAAV